MRVICLRADTGRESVINDMSYSSDVDCKAMEHVRRLELAKLLDVNISGFINNV